MKRSGSLNRRLLVAAAVFLCAALIVAGFVINGILSRFIERQIDQRLDAQLLALAGTVSLDTNEAPQLKRDLNVAPYDRVLSGWYWQAEGPGGVLTSRSLGDARLIGPRGPGGEPLRLRQRDIVLPDEAGTVALVVAAPRAEIDGPLRQARRVLIIALASLGLALGTAMVLQVWLGLLPLRRLAGQLKNVRTGTETALPEPQPVEVQGIVSELNAVLAQNRERLARARAHVANLAHGLKTPLAALSARLDDGGENQRLLALMNRRVEHHLRRARSAAITGGVFAPVPLAPKIADLTGMLKRIHADRDLSVTIDMAPTLSVRCDPQDADEMLGNLLDNAFKWARSEVRITGAIADSVVIVSIADDGPGLSGEDAERALQRGERLDETVAGTGFGLPITQEIAALYGGTLVLEKSRSGGLDARLTLPV